MDRFSSLEDVSARVEEDRYYETSLGGGSGLSVHTFIPGLGVDECFFGGPGAGVRGAGVRVGLS